MTSFIVMLFEFTYFVELNISYQPCKFQLSRMSGSNLTGEGDRKHLPSAAPGGKSSVLLGLSNRQKSRFFFKIIEFLF